MIVRDINQLKKILDLKHKNQKIVMTSGGYDPLHKGHAKCILASSSFKDDGVLVVICNSDEWLFRKKGYSFMSEDERMFIIDSLKGVDYVSVWDDGSPTVCGAIELLKPNVFTKGGDRNSSENVPEFSLCEKIGCNVEFNVGGGKIQSSSNLVKKVSKRMLVG